MEIGIGLDASLGLSYEEQKIASKEAAKLGYTSIWTNETGSSDSCLTCQMRWEATTEVVPGGLTTGIAVSPVALRSPVGFAVSAGTMTLMTGGKFILGIGSGASYLKPYRQMWGIKTVSSLGLMRDYLSTIKGFLAGEKVTSETTTTTLRDARLSFPTPPKTPVYLGALGPEMLRLGGELADGISLNWCNAESVAWSRERMKEGAARSGRNPDEVNMAEYIRICVDDDVALARKALTRATISYASRGNTGGPPSGYRAHFERMGFKEKLEVVDAMKEKGAPEDEVFEAFPDDLLLQVGYYGKADGAAAAFKRISEGLDTAIVRVVAARPGDVRSTRAVMEACQPGKVVGA